MEELKNIYKFIDMMLKNYKRKTNRDNLARQTYMDIKLEEQNK